MTDIRVTYDHDANAAYLQLVSPDSEVTSAKMYACDPVEVGGMINLDFDEDGRLIGVEVLGARSLLPGYLLDAADSSAG